MANGSYGKCAGCGAMVIWVKTQAGKNMPCDPTLHNYKIDPTGKEKIVTQTGKVVTGVTEMAKDIIEDIVDAQSADGFGYISHFATCKSANNFRRGRK